MNGAAPPHRRHDEGELGTSDPTEDGAFGQEPAKTVGEGLQHDVTEIPAAAGVDAAHVLETNSDHPTHVAGGPGPGAGLGQLVSEQALAG